MSEAMQISCRPFRAVHLRRQVERMECPLKCKKSRRCFAAQAIRREVLAVLPAFTLADSADPRTVANSILSAYGLPQLQKLKGFQSYDKFDNDFVLEFPRGWIARRNRCTRRTVRRCSANAMRPELAKQPCDWLAVRQCTGNGCYAARA